MQSAQLHAHAASCSGACWHGASELYIAGIAAVAGTIGARIIMVCEAFLALLAAIDLSQPWPGPHFVQGKPHAPLSVDPASICSTRTRAFTTQYCNIASPGDRAR
jgi:hypothetical protein